MLHESQSIEKTLFAGASKSWDAICVGQTSIDAIQLDTLEAIERVGGSAYIPATLLAQLGLRVGLVSCWGDPLNKMELNLPHLDLGGVIRRPEPAVRITLKYKFQRLESVIVTDDLGDFLTEPTVPRNYYQSKFFYLSPAPLSFLCAVANEASSRGCHVTFAPKEDFPAISQSEMLRRLIAKCSICFVNEHELTILTGERDEKGMSVLHSTGVPVVVTTYSRRGAVVSTRANSWEITPPAIAPTEDVVGAGDCFAAGILAGLSRDWGLYDSAVWSARLTASWLTSRYNPKSNLLENFARELASLRRF